ncbi:MAG TPA: hypothetical protein VFJ90_09105 [Candidatus Didemnitutus sp.]|nr:hypothetical protein [Candidatus Didemnitutus sp.]
MSLRRLAPTVGFVCLLAVGIAPAQTIDSTATGRATFADNLSRSTGATEQKDGMVYDGSASAQWHRQVARNLTFAADGTVGGEWVPKFGGLDNFQFGGQLALTYKFGLGPLAPVLRVDANATRYDFREDGRSGWETTVNATLSKRLTETWRVSLTGQWLDYAAQSHPFDVRNHRFGIDTSWDITEVWRFSAGYNRLSGQLTANADGDAWEDWENGGLGPRVADYYNSVPSAPSTAFGNDWIAYRIDCDADIWWLELSFAVGANTSIPLRYESVHVVNQVDISYDSQFWSLSIVHRF